jgi:hypothetical protein
VRGGKCVACSAALPNCDKCDAAGKVSAAMQLTAAATPAPSAVGCVSVQRTVNIRNLQRNFQCCCLAADVHAVHFWFSQLRERAGLQQSVSYAVF